ncbi:MAG: YdeI/OmpD-associated family protein [Saprospiraceae bacterium]|nr:YdeI/OmpD-associated family protein [Saprospiraceae bacterium]
MIKTENFEKLEVSSSEELREWLLENHQQQESIWLVTYKKVKPGKYVSTSEVLDELLCFGWIDGIRRKLDAERTMQLIGPRRQQHWAKTYKDRAAKLIEEGKMESAGYKSIEVSKENGLWNFMDDVDALIKPDDLVRALETNPPASENFDHFPASVQRFTLRWIKLAKTAPTRTKRIEKAAKLAQKNEKIPGV